MWNMCIWNVLATSPWNICNIPLLFVFQCVYVRCSCLVMQVSVDVTSFMCLTSLSIYSDPWKSFMKFGIKKSHEKISYSLVWIIAETCPWNTERCFSNSCVTYMWTRARATYKCNKPLQHVEQLRETLVTGTLQQNNETIETWLETSTSIIVISMFQCTCGQHFCATYAWCVC
jgi:hypothetical protein